MLACLESHAKNVRDQTTMRDDPIKKASKIFSNVARAALCYSPGPLELLCKAAMSFCKSSTWNLSLQTAFRVVRHIRSKTPTTIHKRFSITSSCRLFWRIRKHRRLPVSVKYLPEASTRTPAPLFCFAIRSSVNPRARCPLS